MLPWTPVDTAPIIVGMSLSPWTDKNPCPEYVARVEYQCAVASGIVRSIRDWGLHWGVSKSTAHRLVGGDESRLILGFANEERTHIIAGRAHPTAWLGDMKGTIQVRPKGGDSRDSSTSDDDSQGTLTRARFLTENRSESINVISDKSENHIQPVLALDVQETESVPLPKWCPKKSIGGVDPVDVYQLVIQILETIKGEVNPKRCSTAAKQVLTFWRSVEDDYDGDFDSFVGDVKLVAKWAQQSPDKMAATDIRAEGWDAGTDRSKAVDTILRRKHWDSRLTQADAWHKAGRPTQVAVGSSESISTNQGGYDPAALVKSIVATCGARWTDAAMPKIQADMSDPNVRATARALARLGGASDVDTIPTIEVWRLAGQGYIEWCNANGYRVDRELSVNLRKFWADEIRRIES